MKISVKVITGANKRRIVQMNVNEIKVYVKAQPVKGKANEEVIDLIAKHFNVRRGDVEIIRGERSRNKVIHISGK